MLKGASLVDTNRSVAVEWRTPKIVVLAVTPDYFNDLGLISVRGKPENC